MTTSDRNRGESKDPEQQITRGIETIRLRLANDDLGIWKEASFRVGNKGAKSDIYIHLIKDLARRKDAAENGKDEDDFESLDIDLGPEINNYSSMIITYADRLGPKRLGSAYEAFGKTVERIASESLEQLKAALDLLEADGATRIEIGGNGVPYFKKWIEARARDRFGFDEDGKIFKAVLEELKPQTNNEDLEWAKLSNLFAITKYILCRSVAWNIMCLSTNAYAEAGLHDEAAAHFAELVSAYAEGSDLRLLRREHQKDSGHMGIMRAA